MSEGTPSQRVVSESKYLVDTLDESNSDRRDENAGMEIQSPTTVLDEMDYQPIGIASLVSRKSDKEFHTPGLNPSSLPLRELNPELFEKVVAEVVSRRYNRGVQFYGRRGQKQYGLDIVELNPQHEYRLYQVKRYMQLTPSEIEKAVVAYAGDARSSDFVGKLRRFNPRAFILVTSAEFDSDAKNVDQLGDLNSKYEGDLEIEIWGSEALNRMLRDEPRLVYAVFGAAWAKSFCGFDPSPQELGTPEALGYVEDPVEVLGLKHLVDEAKSIEAASPINAANLYRMAAGSLKEEGFPGHANLLRRSEARACREASDTERAFDILWSLSLDLLRAGEEVDRSLTQDLQDVAGGDVILSARAGVLAHANEWPGQGTNLESIMPSLRILIESKDSYAPILCCLTLEGAVTDGLYLFVPPRTLVGTTNEGSGALLAQLVELSLIANTNDRELRARLNCVLADASLQADATVEQVQSAYDQLTQDAAAGRYLKLEGLIAARAARQFALHGDVLNAGNLWRRAVLASSEAGYFGDARGALRALTIIDSESGVWEYSYLKEIVSAMPNRRTLLPGTYDPLFNALSAAHSDKLPDAFADARRALLQATLSGHLVEELLAHEMFGDVLSAAGHFGPALNQYVLASKAEKAVTIAKRLQVEADVIDWIGISLRIRRQSAIQVLGAQASLVTDEQVEARVNELLQAATNVWKTNFMGPRPERKALEAVSEFGIRIPETAIDQILVLAQPARIASTGISDTIATLVVNAFFAVPNRREDLSEAIIDMLKLPDPPHNLWNYLSGLGEAKQFLLATVTELAEMGHPSALKVLANWGECTPTVQLLARRACSAILRKPVGVTRTQGTVGSQDSITVELLLTLLGAEQIVDFYPQEFSSALAWSAGGVLLYMQSGPATEIKNSIAAESEAKEISVQPAIEVDEVALVCASPPIELAVAVGMHLLEAAEDILDFGFARVQALDALRLLIDHLPSQIAADMVPRLLAVNVNPQHSEQDQMELENANPLNRFQFDLGTGQLSVLALIVAASALMRGVAGKKLDESGLKTAHQMFAAVLPLLTAGTKNAHWAAAAVANIASADPELAVLALVLVGSPDEIIRSMGVRKIPLDADIAKQFAEDSSRVVRKALATRAQELPIAILELLAGDVDLGVRLTLENSRTRPENESVE